MEKPKIKRQITSHKLQQFLKQQEMVEKEKKYNPGEVQITNSEKCKSKVVNFFGDVHTEAFAARVSANDKMVAVGCANGEAKIYDIYEGKILSIGNTSRMSGFPCTGLKWKPISTDQYIACNCDGTIKWYSSNQETAFGHYQKSDLSYLCCDYQSKEDWCVLGTDQNSLEVFDDKKMKPIQTYEAGGPEQLSSNHHTNRIFSVKCLPDEPNLFFSGGWDSTVQVWDIRVPKQSVRKICGPSVSADSLDLKKGVLLAGNYQNNDIVQMYDFKSGDLIQTLDIKQPHNSSSYCFAASYAHRSEYDLIAVALTGSNKVKIINNLEVVSEIKFQAAPLCLDFYRFNQKDFLIVGGVQGTVYAIKIKVL